MVTRIKDRGYKGGVPNYITDGRYTSRYVFTRVGDRNKRQVPDPGFGHKDRDICRTKTSRQCAEKRNKNGVSETVSILSGSA